MILGATRPDEPSVLQQYPPLPAFLKPPFPVTNEAQLGYAFDETTSPDELLDAASSLRQTPAASYLGLRLLHGRRIDVPLYAYSSALTKGRVARGAKRLARRSRIEELSIVDDRGTSHLDPLSAAPRP